MGMDRIGPEARKGVKQITDDFLAMLRGESSKGKEFPIAEMTAKAAELLEATARAGVISGTLIGGAAAAPLKVRIEAPVERRMEKQHHFSRADIIALAKNVINEAVGETPEGQIAIMQVTLARLASGKFGHTIHDVVYAENQFSWTAHEKNAVAATHPDAVTKLSKTLEHYLRGKSPSEMVRHLSSITGIPSSALFYKRSDWDEYNPQERRMSDDTKEMFKSLKEVARVGNHTFYAEPSRIAKK